MVTRAQIRVLGRLNFGAVRIRTDWDEKPGIKQAFISLQDSGHIKLRNEKPWPLWEITDSGRKLMAESEQYDGVTNG